MTISGNYAYSVSFSATAMRSPVPVPPVAETEPPPVEPGPAPEPLPDLPRITQPGFLETPPVAESDRAARLFAALDRDKDGAVSESEFTEGAKELLKRGGVRRARREHGEDDERSVKRAQRLERRLERLFDRVDSNRDGSVDVAELAAALNARRPRHEMTPPVAEPTSEGDPTSTAGSTVTVTATLNVTVAVQQYARASQGEAPQGTLETAV